MTVQLPHDLENSVQAAAALVVSFASVDDASGQWPSALCSAT